jgi:YebC/PmpR family DNA-binding regulatory protein
MSGHNKWSTIKHKKGAADAKRSKVFTKIIKELTIAARLGGGDPNGNPRLRTAIAAARVANMPKDNVTNAIKKGTGELEGVSYEECVYEAYGPGGVALVIEVMTDNKKRTVAEMRHILTKYNGALGESGSVAWQFESKGYIAIEKDKISEDALMEVALEVGAQDTQDGGEVWEVYTEPSDLETVRSGIEAKGIDMSEVKLGRFPKTTVSLDEKKAEQMLKLMEIIEDSDDVQNVYANFDIDDAIMEKLGG